MLSITISKRITGGRRRDLLSAIQPNDRPPADIVVHTPRRFLSLRKLIRPNEAIDALLALANPGALIVLAINSQHFESHGFAAKFDELAGKISELCLPVVRYYGDAATGDHKDDTGKIATFRKI